MPCSAPLVAVAFVLAPAVPGQLLSQRVGDQGPFAIEQVEAVPEVALVLPREVVRQVDAASGSHLRGPGLPPVEERLELPAAHGLQAEGRRVLGKALAQPLLLLRVPLQDMTPEAVRDLVDVALVDALGDAGQPLDLQLLKGVESLLGDEGVWSKM